MTTQPDHENKSAASENAVSGSRQTSTSPTYAAEFRLLVLHGVADVEQPVHCDLETYSHGDCPEYEAVSYSWGGENGDSTRSEAVFVGPWWDVLLQTKNCHDMLKHMRPRRGIRLIWVDSLCINQYNAQERGQQVAKMARLFRESFRVVVYLGLDIVFPPKGQHPPRKDLAQITSARTNISLGQLFTRRYFNRIWIIQELVVARHVLIRIGDTEFFADRNTINDIKLNDPDWSCPGFSI